MPTNMRSYQTPPACPGGINENSPAFQRWELGQERKQVPKGRQNSTRKNSPPLSSLRDSAVSLGREPSVETLGYSKSIPSGQNCDAVGARLCRLRPAAVLWCKAKLLRLVCDTAA